MNSNSILYLSYDGMLEPLGYSQVLKYVETLSTDYPITVVSYEKPHNLKNKLEVKKISEVFKRKKIKWIQHIYHKQPIIPATLYDLLVLTKTLFIERFLFKANVVHLRGYVLGIPLVFLNRFLRFKIIFDIRGFWPDEKVDRDGWDRNSYKYKFMKFIERKLFYNSKKIVTLTKMSKDIICKNFNIDNYKISVIRTCADKIEPSKSKKSTKLNFGYLGSTGRAYNFQETLVFFTKLKLSEKIGKLYVFTADDHKEVNKAIAKSGLKLNHIVIDYVDRKHIENAFKRFDCLLFNLKSNFSISASMPTKIGESLSSGTPVVCNDFNKDIQEISSYANACKVIDFKNADPKDIIEFIEKTSSFERCKDTYLKFFSLENGVKEYREIYRNI